MLRLLCSLRVQRPCTTTYDHVRPCTTTYDHVRPRTTTYDHVHRDVKTLCFHWSHDNTFTKPLMTLPLRSPRTRRTTHTQDHAHAGPDHAGPDHKEHTQRQIATTPLQDHSNVTRHDHSHHSHDHSHDHSHHSHDETSHYDQSLRPVT